MAILALCDAALTTAKEIPGRPYAIALPQNNPMRASSALDLLKETHHVKMEGIPFETTDWSAIEPTEHKGEVGMAYWRTRTFANIRVRMVEYTAGYVSDHWCQKGHVLLCIEGELETELADGQTFILKPGMSFQVADGAEAHMTRTETGAKLFIVD
jgi:quercetin dioxygenase-like cupin family protein